jgi:hypothetical protein
VAHSGAAASGNFVQTLVLTDIGWGGRNARKRPLMTAVCGAVPALGLGYYAQRQGSNSSIRWMGRFAMRARTLAR